MTTSNEVSLTLDVILVLPYIGCYASQCKAFKMILCREIKHFSFNFENSGIHKNRLTTIMFSYHFIQTNINHLLSLRLHNL